MIILQVGYNLAPSKLRNGTRVERALVDRVAEEHDSVVNLVYLLKMLFAGRFHESGKVTCVMGTSMEHTVFAPHGERIGEWLEAWGCQVDAETVAEILSYAEWPDAVCFDFGKIPGLPALKFHLVARVRAQGYRGIRLY